MRALVFTVIASLAATAAIAQPTSDPRDVATLCLDPGGISHPASCKQMNASRFPQTPDICLCKGPWRQVSAPWCAPGESPPPDTAALDRARIAFAEKNNNSLIGASFEGKPMCVVKGNGY